MPDPVSLSSGVAGILSLGISACQGLVWYYQGWDDWEDSVRTAVQEVKDVLKFLKLVEPLLGKFSAEQIEVIPQSRSLALQVDDAVGKLNSILDNCKALPSQNGQKHRLKNFARHTLYPFKKSALKELLEAVRQTRTSLTSLLQLLQIDLSEFSRLQIDEVKAETASIRDTIIDAHSKINQTNTTLESLDAQASSTSSTVTAIGLKVEEIWNAVQPIPPIESGLGAVATDTKEILSILALSTGSPPLGERLSQIELSLSTLVSAGKALNGNLSVTEHSVSLFQETRDLQSILLQAPATLQLVCATVEDLKERLVAQRCQRPRECFCHPRRQCNESRYRFGLVRFSATTTNVFKHSRNCRFWNPSSESQSKELAFEFLTSVLSNTIEVSLRVSRGAGGLSISPLLKLRRLVRMNSPVFNLFRLAQIEKHKNDLGSYLDYASSLMLQQFRDGSASPFDVDQCGNTILSCLLQDILWLHVTYISSKRFILVEHLDALRRIILSCITSGVPVDDTDRNNLRNPLETVINLPITPQSIGIAIDLENAGAKIGGSPFCPPRELNFAVRLDSWCESTDCGPLSTAVIHQDEHRVLKILKDTSYAIEEFNTRGQSPLHLASIWPRGMQLLLREERAKTLVKIPDNTNKLPISYAIENGCSEALELLLDARSPLSSQQLESQEVILSTFWSRDLRSTTMAVQALRTRRKQLYDLAKEQLPVFVWQKLNIPNDRILDKDARSVQEALLAFDIKVPDELLVRQKAATVYHRGGSNFSPAQANIFFQAGFRDIDSTDENGLTPLHRACCVGRIFENGIDLIHWLLTKGADIHRTPGEGRNELVQHISGFHMVAYFIGDALPRMTTDHPNRLLSVATSRLGAVAALASFDLVWWKEKVHSISNAIPSLDALRTDLQAVVRNTVRENRSDACVCACATSGCSPVTALLKYMYMSSFDLNSCIIPLLRERMIGWTERSYTKECTSRLPLPVVENIIRFQTFEALGLTHTCCRLGWICSEDSAESLAELFPFCTRDPSNVVEIREEEYEMRQELEVLVERFVRVYKQREEPLGSFLKGIWRMEMTNVLTAVKHPTVGQIDELRSIGVVLQDVDENRTGVSFEDNAEISDEIWLQILDKFSKQ